MGARAGLSLDRRKNAIWRDLDHADSAAPLIAADEMVVVMSGGTREIWTRAPAD